MDNQRFFLLAALGLVLLLIWQAWEQERARVPQTPAAGPPAAATAPPAPDIPAAPEKPAATTIPAAPGQTQPRAAELPKAMRIEVITDLLRAEIDTTGGDVRSLALRQYPVEVGKPNVPFRLLRDDGGQLYVAQSGLIGRGADFPTHKVQYHADQQRFVLADGQDELRVPLHWQSREGIRYTKTYVFRRNTYTVDIEYTVHNTTGQPWSGYLYAQFVRTHTETRGFFGLPTYTGGAIYTPEDKYQKIPFDDMASKPLKREVTGGWVAMLQHYFVGAWLPGAKTQSQFYSDVLDGNRYVIGYKSLAPTEVSPGQSGRIGTQLFVGPKEQKRLAKLAEGMDLTVDYGWLTVIAAPLFWLLQWLHRGLGNWGWAIIVLTILIKAAFYPLSAASYKSMANMKKLQPRLQALKERYGNDKQKFNQAMMELYKTEKINPLGGCLPILIQIPVFIALYWVLLESVELRQAPFVLWIRDLSIPDPYFVLPVVMGLTMYLQQRLNPAPMDPIQKKVFAVMPFVFTVMFLFFPAGLVLYWVVNNILSIAQQWRITQVIEAKK